MTIYAPDLFKIFPECSYHISVENHQQVVYITETLIIVPFLKEIFAEQFLFSEVE